MNIYHLKRTDQPESPWCIYHSCIVVARDEEEARCTHPYDRGDEKPHPSDLSWGNEWAFPIDIEVTLLGTSVEEDGPSFVLSYDYWE